MKFWIYIPSIVLLLLLPETNAIAEEDRLFVQRTDDLLTVKATDARLSFVLQEIERQTGVTIHGIVDMPEKVSIDILKQPLDAALKRLLVPRGYAIVYRGSTLAEVWLLPEGASTTALTTPSTVPTETSNLEDEHSLRNKALDPDSNISQEAYDLLLKHDQLKTMEIISTAFSSDDPNVRLNALQALTSMDGPNTLLSIGSRITDPDPGVRTNAIQDLADMSGPEALSYLQQALFDKDATMRIVALTALESHGSSGLPIIRQALNDRDEDVRAVADALLKQNLQ